MKTIFEPSGDHVAETSRAGCFVSGRTFEPSGFIANTSKLPVRSESKLIVRPSGDHAG